LLFVINAVTGIPIKEIIGEIWLFFGVLILALITLILFPDLVLWLPKMLGYTG
jgi:TRAP-type C4-dicarboxylate transport system permease large subunit